MYTKKIDFVKEKENIVGLVNEVFHDFDSFILKDDKCNWCSASSIEYLSGILEFKKFKFNNKSLNCDVCITIDETTMLRGYCVLDIDMFNNYEFICRLNYKLRVHNAKINIYVDKENKLVIERFCDISNVLFSHSHENQDIFSEEDRESVIDCIKYFLKDKHFDTIIKIVLDYAVTDKYDEACQELEKFFTVYK